MIFFLKLMIISSFVVSFLPITSNAKSVQPIIKIGNAEILGLNEANGSKAYVGIPFAKAPEGNLRFKEAIPLLNISGKLTAQIYPPACPQDQGNVNWYKSVAKGVGSNPDLIAALENISEDCLYLNIWTPEEVTEIIPVMVWIHGGANVNGWSHEPNYRGANLSQKGVIVVSVQYRMGALGFLPVPFDNTPEKHAAIWGMSDLVASLKWVNKFISHFGGDPDNVTLFGESAGGGNIAALMLTPAAKGLFHRAIIQSGAVGPKATIGQDVALAAAKKIYSANGINSIDEAYDKKWQDLTGLSGKAQVPYYHYIVADGHFTMERPNYVSDVPLLIGSNKNENLMYQTGNVAEKLSSDLKEYDNEAELKAFLDQYSNDPNTQADFFNTATGFLCPSLEITTNIKSNSYVYEFTRVRDGAETIGAYHGAEIPYVFNTHDNWLPTDEVDKALTETMMNYWVNFAKTGNPNGENIPKWEAYSTENPFTIELGDRVKRSDQNPQEFCALLN